MRYVYYGGSTPLAALVFSSLLETSHIPLALVCSSDKPVGRKRVLAPPPVKTIALASNRAIEILQPEKIAEETIARLSALQPDIGIVAAYGKIIPRRLLDAPRFGTIGVHPSLLPLYRGPAPILNAIMNGDRETGVALFRVDDKVDHGPVITSRVLAMNERWRYPDLELELAKIASSLLIETLPSIDDGSSRETPQDDAKATFTSKITTEDARIEREALKKALEGEATLAWQIDRKIRAFYPDPGAWIARGDAISIAPGITTEKRTRLLASQIVAGQLRITAWHIDGKSQQSRKS
jgi:methionyl-tRNA formyltransferase